MHQCRDPHVDRENAQTGPRETLLKKTFAGSTRKPQTEKSNIVAL